MNREDWLQAGHEAQKWFDEFPGANDHAKYGIMQIIEAAHTKPSDNWHCTSVYNQQQRAELRICLMKLLELSGSNKRMNISVANYILDLICCTYRWSREFEGISKFFDLSVKDVVVARFTTAKMNGIAFTSFRYTCPHCGEYLGKSLPLLKEKHDLSNRPSNIHTEKYPKIKLGGERTP